MAWRRETYLNDLTRIRNQVNQLFEQELLSAGYEPTEEHPPGIWVPAVDVAEDETAYFLCAEVPGVEPENTEILATKSGLEISGHRRPVEEGKNFLRMERSYGRFRCVLDLDFEVDLDRVQKSFHRGVLTITVPKKATRAGARQVGVEPTGPDQDSAKDPGGN